MIDSFESSLWARATLDWASLSGRFPLPTPQQFPLPLPEPEDEVGVDIFLDVNAGDASQAKFGLRLEMEFEIDPLRTSLPGGITLGRTCRLTLSAALDSEGDLRSLLTEPAGTASPPAPRPRLNASVTAEAAFKLPPFPDQELFRARAGDAEGWMTLIVTATAQYDAQADAQSEVTFALNAKVKGDFVLDVQFPGLPQPEPPLHLEMSNLSGGITFTGGGARDITGGLKGTGRLLFKPQITRINVPVLDYLKPLLEGVALDVVAEVTCAFRLNESAPEIALDLTLVEGAGVRLPLLEALQNLTRERGAPASPPAESSADRERQTQFGFDLSGIHVRLSRNPSLALQTNALLFGIRIPAYLSLSPNELRVGLGHAVLSGGRVIRLLLQLPHITREKMGFPKGVAASRDPALPEKGRPPDYAVWKQLAAAAARGGDDSSVRAYDGAVEVFVESVEKLTGAASGGSGLLVGHQENGEWRVRLREGAPAPDDDAPFHLASGTTEVIQEDGSVKSELLIGCRLKGEWHVLMVKPALQLDSFSLIVPFQNPRDIRLDVKGRFVVEGPFSKISDLAIVGGVSADMIYLSVEADGLTEIEIPEFIPGYEGGSVTVGRLMVGFGYTKRSLAIAFAGGLKLPEKLVNDLDSSDTLGAGVRLPVQSKLSLKLDIIPLVFGNVVIPVPMFQFNWDLRRDFSPGLADARLCQPHWDGLQLIIRDVVRLSLKHISYSPILGIHASSNSDFDGGLILGDERTGLSVVADNIFWAYGLDSGCAVVLAPINALPFFNNFCVSLRLGGFAVHFHAQRPIPSFSPFSVFELLALISDPLNYPIAPDGELANTVRVSLLDCYLTLPEAVRRVFPQSEAMIRKPLNVTINLSTFIGILQRAGQTLTPIGRAAMDALSNPGRSAEVLQHAAAGLQAGDVKALAADVMAMLPPDLFKVRLASSFAGFRADAVLVLTDRDGARAALAPPGPAPERVPPKETITPDMLWDAEAMKGFLPRLPPSPDAPTTYDPDTPHDHPRLGEEFAVFSESDLEAVPPPPVDVRLSGDELNAATARRLKQSDDPVTRYLRGRFPRRLRRMLEEYSGGPLPAPLRRSLVTELNRIIKGGAGRQECIYERGRFAGVRFEPHVRQLIENHERDPLRGPKLEELNRLLLEAAYPDEMTKAVGVLIRARVGVYGIQRFRFIGYVFADGAFSLVTTSETRTLRLRVAGISAALPLRIDGRVTLTGRSRNDIASGLMRAQGSATWNALPSLARMEIRDVDLKLWSSGKFSFSGDATVWLFNDVARLEGRVKISESHCFLEGRLGFDVETVFTLDITARGRLGPRRALLLRGDGMLSILTAPFYIRATVTEQIVEVETGQQLDLPDGPGATFARFLFDKLSLSLRGVIDLRHLLPLPNTDITVPRFELRGSAILEIFGARLEGSCDIYTYDAADGSESKDGQLWRTILLSVEGKLTWQGLEWARGRLTLNPAKSSWLGELTIEGQTSAAFNLTPRTLPGLTSQDELKLASLFFKISIDGSFSFDPFDGLRAFKLKVDWLLAVRLPGEAENGQVIPLGMHSFSAEGGDDIDLPLIHVEGFRLVPMGEFSIPVPTVTASDYYNITCEKRVKDGGRDSFTGELLPDLWWLNIQFPEFTVKTPEWPVPLDEQGGSAEQGGPANIRVPTRFTVSFPEPSAENFQTLSVPIDLPLHGSFRLALVWSAQKLNLKIIFMDGLKPPIFIPFEQAFEKRDSMNLKL